MKLTDEQFKAIVAENPGAKFKIISTVYEFRPYEDYKGICSYLKGAEVGCHGDYIMQVDGCPYPLSFLAEELEPIEVYVEEAIRVKFPCCVPTSEIKDAKTLIALVALFEANGANVYDGIDGVGVDEFDKVGSWHYFGVSMWADSKPFRTDFYDDFEDYNQSEVSSELTLYHVADLLGEEVKATDSGEWTEWRGGEISPVGKGTIVDVKFRDWEEDTDVSHVYSWLHSGDESDIIAYRITRPSVASQEAIAERLEDSPSIGIALAKEGSEKTVVALVSITQEVKYTVVIKGITFTFTQDELDALTEELLGFTTL